MRWRYCARLSTCYGDTNENSPRYRGGDRDFNLRVFELIDREISRDRNTKPNSRNVMRDALGLMGASHK